MQQSRYIATVKLEPNPSLEPGCVAARHFPLVEFNATVTEQDQIAEGLKEGARRYYGMTEGQHMVQAFTLYNNAGSGCSSCGGKSCHVCFEATNNNSSRVVNMCQSNAKMFIRRGDWSSEVGRGPIIAHELGHFVGCLPDEYCSGAGCNPSWCTRCGHSAMGFTSTNLCHNTNHGLDRDCVTPSTPVSGSAWSKLPGIYFTVIDDPDFFDYQNHHFNDYILVW